MIKFLIGGSPCTHWSIAQKNNRETKPQGIGWELFKNYLIAKEKFKPDFFIYENNQSASKQIKEQISKDLEVPLQYINSALVSAQNRQRFYAHNIHNVPQPKDKGIILQDILESKINEKEKTYRLSIINNHVLDKNINSQKSNNIIRIGSIENKAQNQNFDSKQYRVYSPYGKSTTLCGQGGGVGAKTGLYACPIDKQYVLNNKNKKIHIYNVKNGIIIVNGISYPIQLKDGYYIIRKLTPIECERLQTLPDNYTYGISNTQRYKCLGNGWTAEVIKHIISYAKIPLNEKIIVLSLYDGIATGRYCFDSLGYKNVEYHAYEIDKYAIKVAMKNYPDIIQHGDAFQIRDKSWIL